ncbi:hypothetical protein E0H22_07155 [Rhodopseudomonas boonkerdii]|uniref:hypothetical protein n=1 Tax=Rhodopseudomonas boonkerdii TaxID=475937 RepID=UPI001E4155D5|nr:hypothetical protein [Rhodopseudomonas boonkerdii]UGV25483.1 hypothetical protein E0H22_07155 [Rhodopseudomonas boonkerdii]
MADYYPLIARAIAGLDPSAPGEQRRALYERARTALIAQLRSVEPPLSESEITRERLSLEEAVRKVESEAAQRARDASRLADANRPRAGDAFRSATQRVGTPPTDASRGRQPSAPAPSSRTPEERPQRTLRVDPPPIPREPGVTRPAQPPRRSDQAASNPPGRDDRGEAAMRGFRDVTADVDDLGRAAAQANRAARKTYANVPSPTPEFDRLEPSMEDRGAVFGYDEQQPYAQEDAEAAPAPVKEGKKKSPKPKRVSGGFPFKTLLVVGLLLIVVGGAFLVWPQISGMVRGLGGGSSTPAPISENKDGALAPRPKITDRVGQPSDQVAPVAQRVVLYDEDPSEPKGKQFVGTVVWRTEQIKGSGGRPGDVAVRADIDIPERKFKMTMSFRRNNDSTLPASHTAELTFVLPQDFNGGGIANVPGILMKSNEQARGTPLAGLAVKVTDGFFLVGLSNVESDRVRNLQLLKERSWFDIPLVYTNQRRAIIAIEKGSPGERAFNDAFAAWGE